MKVISKGLYVGSWVIGWGYLLGDVCTELRWKLLYNCMLKYSDVLINNIGINIKLSEFENLCVISNTILSKI